MCVFFFSNVDKCQKLKDTAHACVHGKNGSQSAEIENSWHCVFRYKQRFTFLWNMQDSVNLDGTTVGQQLSIRVALTAGIVAGIKKMHITEHASQCMHARTTRLILMHTLHGERRPLMM